MIFRLSKDEAELAWMALEVWCMKLNDESPSMGHRQAGKYVVKRASALQRRLLPLFHDGAREAKP